MSEANIKAAEESIVRHIAANPAVVDELIRRKISRRWFRDPLYGSIVEAAVRLRMGGKPLDPLSIMSFSNNGVSPERWPELYEIWASPNPPGEWDAFLEPLQNATLLKDFDVVLNEARQLRTQNPDEIKQWAPYILNAMSSLTEDRVYDARPSSHLQSETRDVVGQIGIPHLDRFLKGGIWQSSINLFIGISNHGKSTLAYTIAAHLVANGIKVVFVSTEMPPREVGIGVLRPLGGFSDRQVRKNEVDYSGYAERMDRYISIYDYKFADPAELRHVLYWEQPTVVIYDYLRAPDGDHRRREDQLLASLTENLRRLCIDHKVCMFCFGQFSDTKATEFRRRHDVASASAFGSARIYHTMDQVLIMKRHWLLPNAGFFKVKKDKLPPTYISANLLDWEFTLQHDGRTRSFFQLEEEDE